MNHEAALAEYFALTAAVDAALAACKAFDSETDPGFLPAYRALQRAKAARYAHPLATKGTPLNIVSGP